MPTPPPPAQASPAACTLYLHGTPRVAVAGGAEQALEPRAAALCALVVLEPGITRERAAALLWPDSDDPRRNLRQQLLRFRQQFGTELLAGRGSLALAPHVALAAPAGGALLGELVFDGRGELGAWLANQRNAAAERQATPLRTALAAAEAAGAWDEALALAARLLALAPDSEAHHRAVMRLHLLQGDGAAGLAAYQRLVQWLQAHHGAAPQPETQALAQALRQAERPATTALATAPLQAVVPPALLRPPHLVGREAEQAAVQAAWAGHRLAWVAGEAGLGKSRLLDELCHTLGGPPTVLRGQGRPGDAAVPYATLARLLRGLLPQVAALPQAPREQLARVLPELAPAQPLPADGARLALQASLQALLAQAAPGLLVLDDLHFADDASVQMLALLAGADVAPRWLVAARPAEGGSALAAWRDALAEAGGLAEVVLAPLDEAGLVALVQSLGLPQLDARSLAPSLLRHSGGNPLFALETLKAHLGRGASAGTPLPQPASVGLLIERRLRQLSPPALALARMAAVAGTDFDLPLAEQVLGASTLALADAWAELEAAQVLREQAFAHDLVHEAALRSVPAVVARRLHAQVATRLQERGAEPARIAAHWLAAGDALAAVPAQVAAAERALLRFQRGEAGRHLMDAALALREAGRRDEAFDLLFRCAEAWSEVTELALMQQLRDATFNLAGNDAQWARAWMIEARLLDLQGRYPELGEAGRQVLAHASRCGDRALQAHGLNCQYTSAYWGGRLTEALAVAGRARLAWAELGRGDDAATCTYAIGVVQQSLGRLEEADASFEDGAAQAEALQAWPLLVPCLRQRAAVQLDLGHLGAAGELMGRAQQWLQRFDASAEDTVRVLATQAEVLRGQGRYRDALALLDGHAQRFGHGVAATDWTLHLERLWLLLELGRPHAALQAWRDAAASAADTAQRRWQLQRAALALQAAGAGPAAVQAAPAEAPAQDPRTQLLLARAQAATQGPAERAAQLATLAAQAQALGLHAQQLALGAERLQALLAAGEPATAAAEAPALAQGLAQAQAALYPPAAWWAVHQALAAAQPGQAAQALAQARAWIEQALASQVPAEYQPSFREHNAVNRAVLAAGHRSHRSGPVCR